MSFSVLDFIESKGLKKFCERMPADEYSDRIEKVRSKLRSSGLDACFAYGNEYRPGDSGWLTGYDPQIEPTSVIVGQKNVIILGSPDAYNYAREIARVGIFKCLKGAGIPSADYPGYDWVNLDDAFLEACGTKAKDIGMLSPDDLIPYREYSRVEASISGKIIDISNWMLENRYHKSVLELEMMKVAAKIASTGMEAAIRAVGPGASELEIAACADFAMKWLGADRLGFTTMVMSGNRASVNIGRATSKIIEEGDFVLIGLSARYEGLNSALGRTLIVGRNNSVVKEKILEHGVHAFKLAVEKLRFGAYARDVDLASRNYLASVGLEQFYNVGHGIGWTECFEERIVSQNSDYYFPKGIAIQIDVSVKPKPYFGLDTNSVGLRIEDPFIINHDGITERLTDLPLSFG